MYTKLREYAIPFRVFKSGIFLHAPLLPWGN